MQEVNLLSAELIPQHDPFTLKELGVAVAVMLFFLGSFSAWQAYELWSAQRTAQVSEKKLAFLNQEITQLQSATKKEPDSALIQMLTTLEGKREEQRHLAAVLEKEPINHGFEAHLTDLASIEMRSLWFESISLDHGGKSIELKGFSESAEQVPLYLSMLSEGKAFSGYSFDGLRIKRETDVLVSFQVLGPQEAGNL